MDIAQKHQSILAAKADAYAALAAAAADLDMTDKYAFTYQSHYDEPTFSAWLRKHDIRFHISAVFVLTNGKWACNGDGDYDSHLDHMLDILISAFGGER